MLKNILVYYALMFTPLIALFYVSRQINSSAFVICFLTYLLLYRPVLDRLRLIDKGVMDRKKASRFYFPGLSYYYFKELYLP